MKQNDKVYKGHRERMRKKLVSPGVRYLETYELLEMLLYYAIPRKNTHPTAKLLLDRFSTLDSLFAASEVELSLVSGVGGECSAFIRKVARFLNCEESTASSEAKCFSSYERAGEFFVKLFREKPESETAVLLLDASLNYLDAIMLYPFDLSTAAVNPKPFIDAAINARAAACMIAHSHPHSAPFATVGELASNKMLKSALDQAGISLVESFTVSGECYKGFSSNTVSKAGAYENEKSSSALSLQLSALLTGTVKNHEEIIKAVSDSFGSRAQLFEADIQKIKRAASSDAAAELFVIIAALASRRKTEHFKLGKAHTEEEIKSFLAAFYMNAASESVVLISLDSDGKSSAIHHLGDGSVSLASVVPRQVLEKLVPCGSCSFIMAHNHPGGVAEPSLEDIASTKRLAEVLHSCGISLKAHYVVSGDACNKIEF